MAVIRGISVDIISLWKIGSVSRWPGRGKKGKKVSEASVASGIEQLGGQPKSSTLQIKGVPVGPQEWLKVQRMEGCPGYSLWWHCSILGESSKT